MNRQGAANETSASTKEKAVAVVGMSCPTLAKAQAVVKAAEEDLAMKYNSSTALTAAGDRLVDSTNDQPTRWLCCVKCDRKRFGTWLPKAHSVAFFGGPFVGIGIMAAQSP